MAYSDKVLDHYSNPRNVGSMDKNSSEVGTGLVGAPECGDVMKLQIKVNPQTNIIEDAKFKTFGCGSAIASSSLATEWLKGKTVDQALEIKNTDIVNELSLPPVKIHCSVLAEDAIKAAISDYRGSPHTSSRASIASLAASVSRLPSLAGMLPITAVVSFSVAPMYLRAAEATSGGTAGTSEFCTAVALLSVRSTMGTLRLPSTRSPPWPP